jgi:hypothetical protein
MLWNKINQQLLIHKQKLKNVIDKYERKLFFYFNEFYSIKVKENHEKMQKERELKRKQTQAKKEAEAQARLLVLKVIYSSIFLFILLFVGRTRPCFKS